VTRYRFIVDALVELEDAVEYYERAQEGLGELFAREVDRLLVQTLSFPEMGVLVVDMPARLIVRRRIVERFGVEIDYVVEDDALVVIAVFHGKRRPGYWRARLRRI
jgi:toxin ParE1/3/4